MHTPAVHPSHPNFTPTLHRYEEAVIYAVRQKLRVEADTGVPTMRTSDLEQELLQLSTFLDGDSTDSDVAVMAEAPRAQTQGAGGSGSSKHGA
jgi:hypothetical protein